MSLAWTPAVKLGRMNVAGSQGAVSGGWLPNVRGSELFLSCVFLGTIRGRGI